MFNLWTYIGYTMLFCIPPLILLWLRREFFAILAENSKTITLSTAVLTIYGSLIWPIAIHYGAWTYTEGKFTGIKLFYYVYIDDVIWWLFVSFLFSSFIVLSAVYEKRGEDVFLHEVKGLLRSFKNALRGFKTIPLERNSTIHIAVAVFVLLEAVFLKLSPVEWFIVLILIGLVIALEMLNSAIEHLSSRVNPESDAEIRLIKDTAAAGVLIASGAVFIVGIKIFLWKMIAYF